MILGRPTFYLNHLAATVFVAVWVGWLSLLVVSPFDFTFDAAAYPTFLFLVTQIAMLAGLTCRPGPQALADETIVPQRWYDILLILSAISVSSRLVDYFIVRGVPFFDCTAIARTTATAAGPNVFSVVSSITLPAVFAAAALGIVELSAKRVAPRKIAGVALLIASPLYSFSFGGRFPAFMSLAFIIAVILLRKRISLNLIAILIVTVLAFFFLTMLIYLGRLECEHDHLNLAVYSTQASVSEMLQPSPAAVSAMERSSGVLSSIIFYFLNLSQYVLHGVFEFFTIVKLRAGDAIAWGRYEFLPLDRFLVLLSKLGAVPPPADVNLLNPRPGLYSTFWGPTYIDFGDGLPVVAFVFGFVVRFFERKYQSGDLFALPIYALFLVQIAIIPITNGLMAAGSLYANVGLIALWLAHSSIEARQASARPA